MANINPDNAARYDDFDPDAFGLNNGNLFGFPHTSEDAAILVQPVPLELTVSYRTGTGNAPKAILEASPQLDLYHREIPAPWLPGIALLEELHEAHSISREHLPKSKRLARLLAEANYSENADTIASLQESINALTADIHETVYDAVLP